jgi:H+-transporting ATPase
MSVQTQDRPTLPLEANVHASVDLEKMPVDRVIAQLAVEPDRGLSSAEAKKRLAKYGPNAIVEKEISLARQILKHFTGPIAYMIEAAAIVSAIIGHWDDFAIITGLLLFNAALEFWQDHKASNALAALKKGMAPEATVLRDGKWQTVQAATLVPGDIVKVRLGVIVPADLRFVNGDYASIDQAALTGESLPVAKKVGDHAYSGSVVKQGEMQGVVIATGANTFFGRTAKLVAGAGAISHAQKAMFQIGNFLIVVAVVLALIMVSVKVYHDIVIADDWGLADARHIAVCPCSARGVDPDRHAGCVLHHDGAGRTRAFERTGNRLQAVGHRGNGRCRYPVLGQDWHTDQKPAHPRRSDLIFRQ